MSETIPQSPPAACYDFRGHAVRRLTFRGALAFIAREVGAALGYEEGGKRFVRDLTTQWAPEIREGDHWHRVKGAELRQLKADLALGAPVPAVGAGCAPTSGAALGAHAASDGAASAPTSDAALGAVRDAQGATSAPTSHAALGAPSAPRPDPLTRVPEILLLTEEGLNLALMRSRVPLAAEFREWLAAEVVPAIVRTGKYDPAPALALLRAPRPPSHLVALKQLVGMAFDRGLLDVAAELVDAGRRLLAAPGESLQPPPARLRASNRLLARLVQRRIVKGDRHALLLQQAVWRPAEKGVLALLLGLADEEQRVVGHSHRDVADELGISKSTVTAVMGVLARAGVVVCLPSPDGKRRTVNDYRIHVEVLVGCNGTDRPESWDRRRAGSSGGAR